MHYRWDAKQEGFKTGRRQEKRDSGLEGFRTGGIHKKDLRYSYIGKEGSG